MKVTLNRLDDRFHFEGKGTSEVSVHIDSTAGEKSNGSSPMELLLMAVGGCNAIDIVSILMKQRQEITDYKIDVKGERREEKQAKPFSAIHLDIYLEGKIDPPKALRAAELSFEKYCSVSMTLGEKVKITYSIFVNGKEV